MAYFYQYAIALTTTISASGTITINGTTAVVGASTAFTTQLSVGDVISANGEVHAVATITDNTHLTTATAFVGSASGLTYTRRTLTNIESFAPQLAPKGSFQPYSEAFDLGNGLVRGGGLPTDSWKFGYLPKAYRDILRTYCPGASGNVYMRTRVIEGTDGAGEDAFATFQAVAIWPIDETKDRPKGVRVPFELKFRQLVQL